MKIVICEDNRKDQFELRRILEFGGMHVEHSFSNGRELLNWLEDNSHDVSMILLDIIMPVLDGYAAYCEIQKKYPKIKVIFISNEDSADVIRSLIDMGASLYITKPLERDKIIARIKQIS